MAVLHRHFFCNSVGAGAPDSPLFSHVTIYVASRNFFTAQIMVGANTVRPLCRQTILWFCTLYKHCTNHVGDGALDVPILDVSLFIILMMC